MTDKEIEELWTRYREGTATLADMIAIRDDYEADPAPNRCPDFESNMSALVWQLERTDTIDGSEPTVGDCYRIWGESMEESE